MAPEPMATPPSPTSIPVSTSAENVQQTPQPMAPEPMATPPSPTSIPVSTSAENVQQTPPAAQPTQNPNQVQAPTVFDTNQYHLPIEKQKKHNAGKQMLIFGVVFILVLVIGGLLALDGGLIDLGFKLPFDLI
jgi:hypothetical protein